MENNIRHAYRQLIKESVLNVISEGAVDDVTRAARLEQANKAHKAIQDSLAADNIVTIRARKQPRFEDPAVDVNLLNHQGRLILVDGRGVAKEVHSMTPGESGHITVHFKEKGGRAGKMLHLHAGHGAIGDMIETKKDASPYRVSLVGGKMQIKGLPDLSENFNYCYDCAIQQKLQEALFKKKLSTGKKIVTGVAAGLVGLGLGSLGGKATHPQMQARTTATPAVANVGSGQIKAKTATKTPHEIELAGHFIRQSENFSPKAYDIGDGKITIGYGTTQYASSKPVKMGDTITREQAEAEHNHYINRTIIPQMEKQKWWGDLAPHQRAAVISFSYNHGAYWHTKPEYKPMIDALSNPSNTQGVQNAWYKFAHSSKNPSLDKGLRNRAAAELNVFSGAWKPPEPKKN